MDKLQKMFLGAMLACALVLVSPVVSTAATDTGLSALLDEAGATQVSDERASKIRGELSFKRTGSNWLWRDPDLAQRAKDPSLTNTHRVVYFKQNEDHAEYYRRKYSNYNLIN